MSFDSSHSLTILYNLPKERGRERGKRRRGEGGGEGGGDGECGRGAVTEREGGRGEEEAREGWFSRTRTYSESHLPCRDGQRYARTRQAGYTGIVGRP